MYNTGYNYIRRSKQIRSELGTCFSVHFFRGIAYITANYKPEINLKQPYLKHIGVRLISEGSNA